MIKVILWLTLTVGSLFSQEPQMECFMGIELQKVLTPSPDQCQRIQIIHNEFWLGANPLYEKLGPIQERLNDFLWGNGAAGLSKQQAEEQFVEIGIAYMRVQTLVREAEDGRRRRVLEVLNQAQRSIVASLAKQAAIVRLYNEATEAGLIQPEIAPTSSMKGLADRRRTSAVR